jgi:hypothetical protein
MLSGASSYLSVASSRTFSDKQQTPGLLGFNRESYNEECQEARSVAVVDREAKSGRRCFLATVLSLRGHAVPVQAL